MHFLIIPHKHVDKKKEHNEHRNPIQALLFHCQLVSRQTWPTSFNLNIINAIDIISAAFRGQKPISNLRLVPACQAKRRLDST